MDIEKVDKIIQYALARASHEDFTNRELGPIHLIKYIYLADLAFAERNEGRTFTGLEWKFHHFGPWTVEAFNRLEPACRAVGAQQKKIPSQYRDDFTRWYLSDDPLLTALEKELPITITSTIKRAVHEFGADTKGLLHHVYRTSPMLKAAPGEILVFSVQPKIEVAEPPAQKVISIKAQKRRRAELNDTKSKIQELLAKKRGGIKKAAAIRQPRYDAVFEAGCQWLDSLSGPEVKEFKGEAVFSPEMWKSKARFDPELS